MALTTSQILTCLNLPDLRRDNVRALIRYAIDHQIEVGTNQELSDLIDHCFDIEIIDDIPEYYSSDYDKARRVADDIQSVCKRDRIGIATHGSSDFPPQLLSVKNRGKETAPALLYYKGDLAKAVTTAGIAMIGTRKATPEGMKDGDFFGHFAASHGMNVVSGLAMGCDSAAHRGALSARGFTTAILAYGLSESTHGNDLLQRSIEMTGGFAAHRISTYGKNHPAPVGGARSPASRAFAKRAAHPERHQERWQHACRECCHRTVQASVCRRLPQHPSCRRTLHPVQRHAHQSTQSHRCHPQQCFINPAKPMNCEKNLHL